MGISLDFNLDASYKNGRFFKVLSEKSLKFISSRRNSTVALNLSLVLLSADVDLILKEQNCKRYLLGARGIGHVNIVFGLLAKEIALYIRATVAQIGVPGLKGPILGCGVSFPMFLALNKQF